MTTGLTDYPTIKLPDYLDRFVTYLVAERDASPYTVKNYSHEIGEFIEFAQEQGVTQLEQIDRNVLRLYLTWLAAEKKARGSIARRLSELRSFGKFLMRQGVLKANVFDTVSAPKLGQRLPEYLEHDEATALVLVGHLQEHAKSQGYCRTSVPELSMRKLGPGLAELSGVFARHDTSGSEIGRFGFTYVLRLTSDGWKILVAVAHDAVAEVVRLLPTAGN